jgi:hypothetical protein
MKRTKNGSTMKQLAYARKLLNADGRNKRDIALSVNYSQSMAENAKIKIEDTDGFKNAVIALAAESNNLVLAVMTEYKARGLKNFSNKDLNGAMNAISQGWERFNKQRAPDKIRTPEGNRLRAVIMQQVENQTINTQPAVRDVAVEPVISTKEEEPDLDF